MASVFPTFVQNGINRLTIDVDFANVGKSIYVNVPDTVLLLVQGKYGSQKFFETKFLQSNGSRPIEKILSENDELEHGKDESAEEVNLMEETHASNSNIEHACTDEKRDGGYYVWEEDNYIDYVCEVWRNRTIKTDPLEMWTWSIIWYSLVS